MQNSQKTTENVTRTTKPKTRKYTPAAYKEQLKPPSLSHNKDGERDASDNFVLGVKV